MLELYIFLTEISLSLTASILALLLLKGALHTVLTDLCRGIRRAEFWTRFTQLMLIIGPLLYTLLFTPDMGYEGSFTVAAFRETLSHVLTGLVITLSSLGIVIWRTIPRNSADHATAIDTRPSSAQMGA